MSWLPCPGSPCWNCLAVVKGMRPGVHFYFCSVVANLLSIGYAYIIFSGMVLVERCINFTFIIRILSIWDQCGLSSGERRGDCSFPVECINQGPFLFDERRDCRRWQRRVMVNVDSAVSVSVAIAIHVTVMRGLQCAHDPTEASSGRYSLARPAFALTKRSILIIELCLNYALVTTAIRLHSTAVRLLIKGH